MLPFGFIAHLMFNFVKKHTKSRRIVLNYFIFVGVCWTVFGLLGALLMLAYNSMFQPVSEEVAIKFLTSIPGLLFVIGEVYAIVCWIIWLRKEK